MTISLNDKINNDCYVKRNERKWIIFEILVISLIICRKLVSEYFFELSLLHPSILPIRKGLLQTGRVGSRYVGRICTRRWAEREQEERCKAPGALGTLDDGS